MVKKNDGPKIPKLYGPASLKANEGRIENNIGKGLLQASIHE